MPAPIPEETRAAILQDIRDHVGSTRVIAARHGVSDATVRKIAKDEGVTDAFSRERTEKATRARQADLAKERAEVSAKFLRKANELLDDMDKPHLAFSFGGKENSYNEHLLERPPTGDLRNLITSAAVAIDKHLKIQAADAGSGAEGAASMLNQVADALGAAAEALEAGSEPPDGGGEMPDSGPGNAL